MKILLDLKPCPFCGNDKAVPDKASGSHDIIRCGYCSAQGPDAMGLQEAAKYWNLRRPISPASKKKTPSKNPAPQKRKK
jgi:Lar family restriction alleviation protein